MKMLGKDSSRPLGMTMAVISNEVRDLFFKPIFEGGHEEHEVWRAGFLTRHLVADRNVRAPNGKYMVWGDVPALGRSLSISSFCCSRPLWEEIRNPRPCSCLVFGTRLH